MRIPTSITDTLSNERGISLIAVGIWMTAFFALTAVGVDVGRISYTASEAQSAADLAALAGARAIVDGASPQTAADTLLGSGGTSPNQINGQSAYAGTVSRVVERGSVSNAGVFTAGTAAADTAARATIVADVSNLFSGVFGSGNATTQITKIAIAAFATVGSGRPDLPLALSGGCFDTFNCTAGNCPSLNTQTNNAGWTGLTLGHSSSTTRGLIPSPCGGGNTPPVVNIGDTINNTNGSVASAFHDLNCMVCDQHRTEFLLAVVDKPCTTGFNGDFVLKGFATVTIDAATYCAPGHDEKVVPLQAVRRAGEPGTIGGCANCGTGQIRIVG